MPIGLDIGGANLKAAHANGVARSRPFALWKEPTGLAGALRGLLAEMPPVDVLAVTMTGELCDCFESKRQGVHAILDAVEAVAEGRSVRVWRTDGSFVSPAAARAAPLLTAAANWHALATYAGRFAPKGPALLLDIGSTTTDAVPLCDGRPVPQGLTDPERLKHGELVYTGMYRTPVCALAPDVAAEFFATTRDVYLLLDWLPEAPDDCATADGRPATRACAHARMARMLCADADTCTRDETRRLAERVLLRQVYQIGGALGQAVKRLHGPPQTIVLAGSGEQLAQAALTNQAHFPPVPVCSLAQQFGPEISRAACAYALAVLAAERP
ncbi:MAG: H4MPT-linked C1 transfer pathway protein [Gemmataceae bacterium]|nr:H4MPT-linked C1 transfer pathway protein [Gemmataceae bacterium]